MRRSLLTVTVPCPACEEDITVTLCPFIPARGFDPPEGGEIESWKGHPACDALLNALDSAAQQRWTDACWEQASADDEGAYDNEMDRRYERSRDA